MWGARVQVLQPALQNQELEDYQCTGHKVAMTSC